MAWFKGPLGRKSPHTLEIMRTKLKQLIEALELEEALELKEAPGIVDEGIVGESGVEEVSSKKVASKKVLSQKVSPRRVLSKKGWSSLKNKPKLKISITSEIHAESGRYRATLK